MNLYKKFESIYEHQFAQVEKQLTNQKKFNWNDEEMAEVLSSLLNQSDHVVYIIDQSGEEIFVPDRKSARIPVLEEYLKEINEGNNVSKGGMEDGELRYTIAMPLNIPIDGAEQPYMIMIFDDLNHEYLQVIWMIFLTFIIAILFAGVIVWFMSKKITAPSREMSEVAKDYAKGDFSKAVQYELNDEVGQLAKSFNNMANELNNLETMRKQFISNVSHELRSPLTSIKGFIIGLKDGTIPEERRFHYYGLMKDETERMIKLVNDTLDMNQLEENPGKINRTDYNLTEQMKTILRKLEPHRIEKGIEFRFQPKQDYYVYADQEQIEQVLINLIHNAIQFSKEQGKVVIALTSEGKHVKVVVKDYGIGIDEQQIDLIWRRFYKVDEARTSKSGSGLGLAIVKSILDLHETEINVQSKLGEGTTFSFLLPLSK